MYMAEGSAWETGSLLPFFCPNRVEVPRKRKARRKNKLYCFIIEEFTFEALSYHQMQHNPQIQGDEEAKIRRSRLNFDHFLGQGDITGLNLQVVDPIGKVTEVDALVQGALGALQNDLPLAIDQAPIYSGNRF